MSYQPCLRVFRNDKTLYNVLYTLQLTYYIIILYPVYTYAYFHLDALHVVKTKLLLFL